jgi:hypothetical protein
MVAERGHQDGEEVEQEKQAGVAAGDEHQDGVPDHVEPGGHPALRQVLAGMGQYVQHHVVQSEAGKHQPRGGRQLQHDGRIA